MPDGAAAARGQHGVVEEILAALSLERPTLPPKLFYDEAGCELFNRITGLDEYYVTRAETALLDAVGGAIAAHAPPGAVLVEYGASDEAKAEFLLRDGRFAAYVPIDIAHPALAAMAARLRDARPSLAVHPVAADFLRPLALPAALGDAPRFGFFPGSTIGNLEPPAAVRFLDAARDTLATARADPGATGGPRLCVGTDLRKDVATLIAAYDDREGVTASFNRNILAHVNRLAGADFEPDRFAHEARWNEAEGRIEMHLVARDTEVVRVAGRVFRFAAGSSIHTENSYKHTPDGFLAIAARAGWRGVAYWTDAGARFGIHLLEADPRAAGEGADPSPTGRPDPSP